MLVNLSCWTGCLDEVSYKQSSLVKNTFLITCKSCPFPVRRHIFNERDLAFINEGSCFSQIFSHVIESSRPSGTKQMLMRMLKACKQSPSRSKLDFFFFYILLLFLHIYPKLFATLMFHQNASRRLSCFCFNDS